MPFQLFDRGALAIEPLAARASKVHVPADLIGPDRQPAALAPSTRQVIAAMAACMRAARARGRPVMLAFGAHTIKNGLGPVLIYLMEQGWLQHLATNGAGIIHDWELAFEGATSEDVRAGVERGQFGIWEETGRHLNLALLLGAFDGLGYGESIGRLIATQRHVVPARTELLAALAAAGRDDTATRRAAAAADLLAALDAGLCGAGTETVPHAHPESSPQAAAWRLGIPFTAHPMIGHDIIYTHPLNSGAAIGRTAERDFLAFANNVAALGDGGVYLSVGSAVMSPMIFEKSLSMARNVAHRQGRTIRDFHILVADLAPSRWDWSRGEPPMDSPDYYLRYCKSFSRMGGTLRYLCIDNRDLLLALVQELGAA